MSILENRSVAQQFLADPIPETLKVHSKHESGVEGIPHQNIHGTFDVWFPKISKRSIADIAFSKRLEAIRFFSDVIRDPKSPKCNIELAKAHLRRLYENGLESGEISREGILSAAIQRTLSS